MGSLARTSEEDNLNFSVTPVSVTVVAAWFQECR